MAKTVEANGADSVQEAKLLLQQNAQDRVNSCSDAIKRTLEQYHCVIVAIPQLTQDGRIQAVPAIQAVQED